MFRILSNVIIEWSFFNFLTMYWWQNACHKKTLYELSRLFSFGERERERERESEREMVVRLHFEKKKVYSLYKCVCRHLLCTNASCITISFFFLIFTIFHKFCFNFSKLNGVILASQLRCRVYFTQFNNIFDIHVSANNFYEFKGST